MNIIIKKATVLAAQLAAIAHAWIAKLFFMYLTINNIGSVIGNGLYNIMYIVIIGHKLAIGLISTLNNIGKNTLSVQRYPLPY